MANAMTCGQSKAPVRNNGRAGVCEVLAFSAYYVVHKTGPVICDRAKWRIDPQCARLVSPAPVTVLDEPRARTDLTLVGETSRYPGVDYSAEIPRPEEYILILRIINRCGAIR